MKPTTELCDEDSGTSDEAWGRLLESCRHRVLLLLRLFRAAERLPSKRLNVLLGRWRIVMEMKRE